MNKATPTQPNNKINSQSDTNSAAKNNGQTNGQKINGQQSTSQINSQIDEIILQLWHKNLPTTRERLDLLDRFGLAASHGTLDEPTRVEALNIAHKLAGSLGMYGYPQGTQIASKMERILKSPTPETLTTLRILAAELRKSLTPGL